MHVFEAQGSGHLGRKEKREEEKEKKRQLELIKKLQRVEGFKRS